MLRPLEDRVLVRQDNAAAVSAGGIILPEAGQERPMTGVVLAVGDGKDSQRMPLKAGAKVLFSKFGGVKVRLNDYHPERKEEELIVMKLGELLLAE